MHLIAIEISSQAKSINNIEIVDSLMSLSFIVLKIIFGATEAKAQSLQPIL